MSKIEVYCCTCGVYKNGETSGDHNPTTMCSKCTTENANFCITCGTQLYNQSITLCKICY